MIRKVSFVALLAAFVGLIAYYVSTLKRIPQKGNTTEIQNVTLEQMVASGQWETGH